MELRDGRYRGKGVRQAVRNIEETIAPEVEGLERLRSRRALELQLDGTPKAAWRRAPSSAVSLAVAGA